MGKPGRKLNRIMPHREDGRAVNSKFANTIHGISSGHELIPGEECDRDIYDNLKAQLADRFMPVDDFENQLVEQALFGLWRMRRGRKAENMILIASADLDNKPDWDSVMRDERFESVTRYEREAQGQFHGAIKMLMRLKGMDNKDDES